MNVSRIVNGNIVNPTHYLFFVSLFSSSSNSPYCGGALIARDIVLTAAHCVTETVCVTVGRKTNDCILVKEKVVHHEYNQFYLTNDIGLLFLSNPAPSQFPVIYIPDVMVQYNVDLKAIGYGTTIFEGQASNDLMETTLEHVSCTNSDGTSVIAGHFVDSSMICAYKDNTDTCQGDSGGPLFNCRLNENCYVHGLTSWGIGCATNYPGVYTNVFTFRSWIISYIDGSVCNKCYGRPLYIRDGDCDDGSEGSQYSYCSYGSDCDDCGNHPIHLPPSNIPPSFVPSSTSVPSPTSVLSPISVPSPTFVPSPISTPNNVFIFNVVVENYDIQTIKRQLSKTMNINEDKILVIELRTEQTLNIQMIDFTLERFLTFFPTIESLSECIKCEISRVSTDSQILYVPPPPFSFPPSPSLSENDNTWIWILIAILILIFLCICICVIYVMYIRNNRTLNQ